VRPGHEHAPVDAQLESAEALRADDVGERLARLAPRHEGLESLGVAAGGGQERGGVAGRVRAARARQAFGDGGGG
jgi:hypothetical protein